MRVEKYTNSVAPQIAWHHGACAHLGEAQLREDDHGLRDDGHEHDTQEAVDVACEEARLAHLARVGLHRTDGA